MVRLTINNQSTEVPEGITLLQAIEKTGVKIPTLCHHKALTPYGACRLCVVEVAVPGRPASVQASCSYPALDGISVLTHSERGLRARRIVAELLLARSPDSEVVKRVAAELGVLDTRIEEERRLHLLRSVRPDVRGTDGKGRHRLYRGGRPRKNYRRPSANTIRSVGLAGHAISSAPRANRFHP